MKNIFGIKLGTLISVILSFVIAIIIWLYVGYISDGASASVFESLLI